MSTPRSIRERWVYIDSSAYLALLDVNDANHTAALLILRWLSLNRYRLYTTNALSLCCVIGAPDPSSSHELPIAFIVGDLDLDALRAAAQLLPPHARPAKYIRVDSIPLTDGYRPIKSGLRLAHAESEKAAPRGAATI